MSGRTIDRRSFMSAVAAGLASGCAYTPALSVRFPEQRSAGLARVKAVTAAPGGGAQVELLPFTADVHCHTFNARDLPIDGFIRSLAQGMGMPPLLDRVLAKATSPFHRALVAATPADTDLGEQPGLGGTPAKVKAALDELVEVIAKLGFASEQVATLITLARTLANVTKARTDVASTIARAYPEVELFTPALVDFELWVDRGKKAPVVGTSTSPRLQIDAHAKISEASIVGEIPDCKAAIHPFAPFNPWRYVVDRERIGPDGEPITVLHDVKRAVEELGFVGVKMYPPSGFLPLGNAGLREFRGGDFGEKLDAGLRDLYQWCVQKDVPILTHASMGNSFFRDSSWRGSPWGWRHVLGEFPALRLCFGHFGHLEGIDGTADTLSCVAWAEGFLDLMLTYDNVYADISNSEAANHDEAKRKEYQRRFLFWLCKALQRDKTGKLAQRILYGSDWWMGMLTGLDREFLHNIKHMIDVEMQPYTSRPDADPSQRFAVSFWGENALRYLGIRDDNGAVRDDGTAARLKTRYESVFKARNITGRQLPRWLAQGT